MKKIALILVIILGLKVNGSSQNIGIPNVNNPSLFGGGKDGFGKAFAGFLTYQNFDLALKFTSKESIKKHGSKAIMNFYKSCHFNYKLFKSSESVDGKYITLRYKTNQFGTGVTKDFTIVIENDSCKVVLPNNLSEFLK